eukprot:15437981-Alexandrium_andersonii.AAC.2
MLLVSLNCIPPRPVRQRLLASVNIAVAPDSGSGVVPSHLKQGVLNLLGTGPEVEACGRFIHQLAARVPAALVRLRRGDEVRAAFDARRLMPKTVVKRATAHSDVSGCPR